MAIYLGILLFSFIVTSISIVPFIDLLYRLKFKTSVPPAGGGILLIGLICILFAGLFTAVSRLGLYIDLGFPLREELNTIFFTFISFGVLGFYSDLVNAFNLKYSHKYFTFIQILLSFLVALLLYQNLHIQIINLPLVGVVDLGWLYLPFATALILLFSHSFWATDHHDGSAAGILLISLLAFWSISVSHLDTPLSVFIAIWVGSLIAFLYFNVYPARIRLGSSGSLSFGATLAVTGLLLGKSIALLIIGGIFIIEATPLRRFLHSRSWPEPKIMMRLWLLAFLLAVIGLWFSGL